MPVKQKRPTHLLLLLLCKQKELSADGDCPKMCAYKLVTIKFKWWGLQNKIENFIQKVRSWECLSELGGDKLLAC